MGRKPKKRIGRPPKPQGSAMSEIAKFAVDPARARLYEKIVAERFNSNFSAFARMACDAFAEQLGYDLPADRPSG
jgi:hypothetical protein